MRNLTTCELDKRRQLVTDVRTSKRHMTSSTCLVVVVFCFLVVVVVVLVHGLVLVLTHVLLLILILVFVALLIAPVINQ